MTLSLRGGRIGRLRVSISAALSLGLAMALVLMTGVAAGQLVVGQPIDFGSTNVGTTISLQVVFSASNTTTVSSASVLTDGATGEDFVLTSNGCSGTIQQNTQCTATVAFTPGRVGVRHGIMELLDGSNNVVSQVFLHGIGLGASFAFAPATVTDLNTAPGLSPSSFTTSSTVQDGYGNFFFTDIQNGRILEQTTGGAISQIATLPVSASSSMAIAADGTLFVTAQNSVYAFKPGRTPTPLTTGSVTFIHPTGLAVDTIGDLYIMDASTNTLAKYSMSSGTTTTLPVVGISPALSNPLGLALDANNNLYVADSGNDRVVEINTVSGNGIPVALSGLTLSDPTGLTIDAAGTIYVTDTGNHRLVEFTVQGVDFALTDPNLTLVTPTGVLDKANGDLIISDNVLGQVLVPRSTPAVNFPTSTTVGTLDSTDGAVTLTLQSTGNSVAQLVFPTSGSEPAITSTAYSLTNAGTCPAINSGSAYTPTQFTIGEVCTYTLDFTPTVDGLNSANLNITTSLPGGSQTATTTVPLTGTGLSTIATFSLVATPSTINVGGSVELVLTAMNASGGTAADYVGTVTFTDTDPTSVFLGGTTYTFTAADNGVLTIPASSGVQFNQTGTFTVHATDATHQATSNQVHVVEPTRVSTFTSSVNPSLPNQTTVLTATIVSTSGTAPAPTGTVNFYSGTTLLGTGTLSNGVAILPVSFPNPGSYVLTAIYSGDANNAGSTSGTLTQVVLYVTAATSFTSSINPSLVNQNTVLTLTLASSGPTPTGTVNFYSGTRLLGTGNVVAGVATITVSFAAAGSYPLTAVYSGDASNATVTAALTQVVLNPDVVTLTSSINPSLVGQQTILTATITTANAAPTGTVSFYDGTTLLGTSSVANNVATLPASFSTVGIHTLTAVYSGDASNLATTSSPYAQDVVTPTVVDSFTSSINPSLVNQQTVLTLTLAGTGSAAPTGTVSFYDGATLLGTAAVSDNGTTGAAQLPVSFAAVGAYPLTAVYSGDGNNAAVTAGPLTQVVVAPGAIVLTSSVNPSAVSQPTVLTAYLGTSSATGTISFYDGTTLLGTSPVAAAQAALTVSFSTVGIHTLTAVYSGDANDASVTSAPLQQNVVNATASTSFTSSVNPSQINQNTLLTLSLSTSNGAPTGTVSFYNGATLLGTGTLNNGVATLSVSFPTAGSYPLTAVYGGDSTHSALTAGPLTQVVVSSTTVVLTSSVNPSLVGQSTTLSAFLGSSSASGSVSFYDGTTLLGTAPIVNGVATLPVSFSTPGTHSLTATNASITSAVYTQIVENTDSATLAAAPTSAGIGQTVTLTATIHSTGSGSPTGTVQFYSGSTLLGTAAVSNSAATLPVSFNNPGTLTLTCRYSGDTSFEPASCAPITELVQNPASISLVSSVNPASPGQNVTFTATVSSGGATPTGTVIFYNNGAAIGTASLASGSGSVTTTFANPGSYPITAVYSGDANNSGVTSAPLTEIIRYASTVVLTSSVNPVMLDNQGVLTAVVSSSGPTPTGSVTFYDGDAPLGNAVLTAGKASMTVTFPISGAQALTAVYYGDAVTAPGTSPAVAETVGDISVAIAPGTPASTSVLAGGTGSYSLMLSPLVTPELAADVTLSVSGLPKGATATLTPGTVAAGSDATPFALTVNTPAILSQMHTPGTGHPGLEARHLGPIAAALLLLPALFRRRRAARWLLAMIFLAAATAGLSGCLSAASSGYYGQTQQSYTITVTATSGALSRTTQVTLIVE